MSSRDPVECPECGAQFKAGRLACPECGSDAETGWKDENEIQYQSVEIPDYLPDLDAKPEAKAGDRWFRVAAILAILACLVWVFGRAFW